MVPFRASLFLFLLPHALVGATPAGPAHNGGDDGLFSPAKPSFLFLLVDDIGWADFRHGGGIAATPNIDAWASRPGSVLLRDMHSAGTVCSPTRATVLTGRHHFRDCVDAVYGCSDMTECVPNFEFAPGRTFTVGDAVRSASSAADDGPGYGRGGTFFAGKWHLGSFYNDSEAYGGLTSSPLTHGFDRMNATVGVVPTATVNCQCRAEWTDRCEFGHYGGPEHCQPRPGVDCCFNYWWDDPLAPHGVTNLTEPTPADDALYLADAFSRFLADRRGGGRRSGASGTVRGGEGKSGRGGKPTAVGPPPPFFAQISFHNCHIPFVGSKAARDACARNETCVPPREHDPPYTSEELDYYACVSQLDAAVGEVLSALGREGYYDNTMVWLASDNGPERNCPPSGVCRRASDRPERPEEGPGSAGPLRGRKRDAYEGGHRVPGIISWPARVGEETVVSWETVSTVDFLPTLMEAVGAVRPPSQSSWAMDGRSVLRILRGGTWEDTPGGPRSMGFGFYDPRAGRIDGWGFRHGRWKYVEGSASCKEASCQRAQLYDLNEDIGERRDLSEERPEVLEEIMGRFAAWLESVGRSRRDESRCRGMRDLRPPPSLQLGSVMPNRTGGVTGKMS